MATPVEYRPAPHDVQLLLEVKPTPVLKVPEGHTAHTLDPACAYRPTPHVTQLADVAMPTPVE